MKNKLYLSFRTAPLYKSRIVDCCFYIADSDKTAVCYQLSHSGLSTKQIENFNEVLEDDKVSLIHIPCTKSDSVLAAISKPLRKAYSSVVWAAECLGLGYPLDYSTDELYEALQASN